jgi:hypothetical protein
VHPDSTATGSLINTTISFMELRDQRIPRARITDVVRDADSRCGDPLRCSGGL